MVALLFIYGERVLAQASDNLINSIMELRSDVESLYSSLQDGKQDHRANMRSYAAQKADLEAQINRQKIALQQIELDITKARADIDRVRSRNLSLEPVILEGIALIKEQTLQGLPFKRSSRLADLEKLTAQVQSDALTEEKALGQVWAGFEDLLRMSRENGLFKQEIVLDGEPTLVDIAKIGSIMLFYRTSAGQVGYARRTDSATGYEFTQTESMLEQEQIIALFDSMEKQIRNGFFELPGQLFSVGGAS